MPPIYRHPVTNIRLLRALFFEMSDTADGKEFVLYTLKDVDHKGYPSLYRLYMEMDDLTEYEFANKYLDGWGHWKALKECTWFKEYAERWYEELTLRTQAKALRALKEESETDGKNSYNAQKYLLEKGWEPKDKSKTSSVGRPSKDAIKKQAEEMFDNRISVEEDLKRLKTNKELVN